MSGFAWVTLATNDSYSLGALVLAHSLKQVGTTHQLVVLVTPGVTNIMRKNLAEVFNVVQEVNLFDSKDEANLRLLQRPELGVTFTKLHCWRLTQFEKCVFLDADVLVLVNCDELFERDEFSAAPDVGWPDCFNSGVFVYRPSLETYNKLVDFALQKGSFDGGDQGLLNAFFSDWAYRDIQKHLPFIYNMCSTASYSYLPAFKYYGANVKIVHFIGPAKPWLQYFNTESRQVHPSPDLQHLQIVLQKWWDIFCSLIHPKLSPEMSGLAGAFAQFTLDVGRSPSQEALENHLRRQAWEVGNIDYMGRDSFDNIWNKICQTLQHTSLTSDGAVSSPESQQAPAPKEEQQVLPTTILETSRTPATGAVALNLESAETLNIAEDKPKEKPQEIAQKDTAESSVNLLQTVEAPDVSKSQSESAGVEQIKTEHLQAKEETVQVNNQMVEEVVKPDIIPEPEPSPAPEKSEPKSEIQSELTEKMEESTKTAEELDTHTSKIPKSDSEIKPDVPIETEELIAAAEKKLETTAEQIQQAEQSTDIQLADTPSEQNTNVVQEVAASAQDRKLEEVIPETITLSQQKVQSESLLDSEVSPTQEAIHLETTDEAKTTPAKLTEVTVEKLASKAALPEEKINTKESKSTDAAAVQSSQALKEAIVIESKIEDESKPVSEIKPLVESASTADAKPDAEVKLQEAAAPETPVDDIVLAQSTVKSEIPKEKISQPHKVETMSEKPSDSVKSETALPPQTARAEASGEASAQLPKSDIKPKETRKIKKKVKKVPKADTTTESESKK